MSKRMSFAERRQHENSNAMRLLRPALVQSVIAKMDEIQETRETNPAWWILRQWLEEQR